MKEPNGRVVRPFSVVMGLCGVDGALLKVVSPFKTEHWGDLSLSLRELNEEMRLHRERAGLSPAEVPPVGHSTDVYGLHKFKVEGLYTNLYGRTALQVEPVTPKGDPLCAFLKDPFCPTIPTGEPCHYQYKLRRLVSPKANDCRVLLQDHNDAISRLSADLPEAANAAQPVPIGLEEVAEPLLVSCVEEMFVDARLLLIVNVSTIMAWTTTTTITPQLTKIRIDATKVTTTAMTT